MLEMGTSGLMSGEGKQPSANRLRSRALPRLYKMVAQCAEREKLLHEWTQCGRQLEKILDEHLAATKRSASSFADFKDQFC